MKNVRNNQIYLPDYFTGRMAKSFDLERDRDILHWDFSTDASETVKKQVEWILGHVVKNIKYSEERRNQYLFPLKILFQYAEEAKISDILLMETAQVKEYSARLISKTGKLCGSPEKFVEFCRRELFLAEKEPAWHANVVDGLSINPERYASGSVIRRFSFLDIVTQESERKIEMALQEIKSASDKGKIVTVSELSRKTGLSKGFFYKNEQVRAALDAARQEKEGEHLIRIRKEIVEYSIEKENELYKRELEKLKKENEELKKENQKLKKALDKTRLAYLEFL